MENCTIYSHNLEFDKVVQIVKSCLPKASVEYNDAGMRQSIIATIKSGFFSKPRILKINYRQRQNPSYKLDKIECSLTQNLAGMVNFIRTFPAKNDDLRNRFLYKVMAANCEIAFVADPEIDKEFAAVLRNIVVQLDGFIFVQPSKFFRKSGGPHFLDKNLDLIIDSAGNCEIHELEVNVDVKYHDQSSENYSEEQLSRKAKSEIFLAENGVKVNKSLPCIPSSVDVEIRDVKAVIDRVYALLVIAAKGEGVEQDIILKVIEDKNINSLSSKEKVALHSVSLSDHERANATWRYESLYTMLWALSIMDDLKYPSDICDVQAVVGTIFQPSREEFEKSVNFRNKSAILDELDKTYRMNWFCVDAKIKGQQVTGNLNPSVIYERHYSLNWLINYQNQEWDDVQTTT